MGIKNNHNIKLNKRKSNQTVIITQNIPISQTEVDTNNNIFLLKRSKNNNLLFERKSINESYKKYLEKLDEGLYDIRTIHNLHDIFANLDFEEVHRKGLKEKITDFSGKDFSERSREIYSLMKTIDKENKDENAGLVKTEVSVYLNKFFHRSGVSPNGYHFILGGFQTVGYSKELPIERISAWLKHSDKILVDLNMNMNGTIDIELSSRNIKTLDNLHIAEMYIAAVIAQDEESIKSLWKA